MKILFVTNEIPYFTGGGTPIRQFNLLKNLSNEHLFTLVCFQYQETDLSIKADELKNYCEKVILVTEGLNSKIKYNKIRSLINLLDPLPTAARTLIPNSIRTEVKDLLRKETFDIMHVDNVEMGSLLNETKNAKRVIGHDAISPKLKQYYRFESNQKRRILRWMEWVKFWRYERNIYRKNDLCTMSSDREKEIVLRMSPGANVVEVPNGVDTSFFKPAEWTGLNDSLNLLFVGSLSYRPNHDAVVYFYNHVWPILQEKIPSLHWTIIGRHPKPEIMDFESAHLQVVGWVNDIRPYMENSLAMIVPLRMGSGTRIKILEAMSAGLPVISTTLGVEGLDVCSGKNILIADTPDQFADCVMKLSMQPRLARKICANARRLVEENYDWRRIALKLDSAYKSLAQV